MRVGRGAQDLISQTRIEMWRAQNRTKVYLQELWASDLEATEVSGALNGDQDSLKEGSKSSRSIVEEPPGVFNKLPRGICGAFRNSFF